MTTQESKQQYEGASLQQLIKNFERLAVIENDLSAVKKSQETTIWLLISIAIGVLINIISLPVVNFLSQ